MDSVEVDIKDEGSLIIGTIRSKCITQLLLLGVIDSIQVVILIYIFILEQAWTMRRKDLKECVCVCARVRGRVREFFNSFLGECSIKRITESTHVIC